MWEKETLEKEEKMREKRRRLAIVFGLMFFHFYRIDMLFSSSDVIL
jgi:hypothetical protein